MNPFARLGLPESLLLQPAEIEEAWRRHWQDQAAAGTSSGGDEAAAANQARSVLSDPVTRLEAWLEAKCPGAEKERALAPELMDLFARIQPVLAAADSLLNRHRRASTALARALLAKEAVATQLEIQGLLAAIQPTKTVFLDRFPEFEEASGTADLAAARRALGSLKFLKRWEEQCRERLLALLAT